MKSLALLPIVGAFSLFGSAFSGVWTPPGLEDFPTYEVVLAHAPWGEEEEFVPEPKAEVRPIARTTQFKPNGVFGNWENQSIVALPEQIPVAADTVHPLIKYPTWRPRKVETKPIDPTPKSQFPKAKSYTQLGTRSEYRVAVR